MKRLLLTGLAALLLGACAGPKNAIDVSSLEELPADNYVYRIEPGDVIEVEIAEDEDYKWETAVLPDGSATFRYAGELVLIGHTLGETRQMLRDKLKSYYVDPTMTVHLKRPTGPDPIVVLGNFGGAQGNPGQAERANVVPYRKGMGVVEVVARAGGPGEPDVDVQPYIYVIRNSKSINDRKVYRFDLAATVRGDSPNLPVHPGDIVFMDQSWLQDLERAFSVTARVVGIGVQGLTTALLIDTVADR